MKHFIGYVKDNPGWIVITGGLVGFWFLNLTFDAPAFMWWIWGATVIALFFGTMSSVRKRKFRYDQKQKRQQNTENDDL